MLIWLSLFIPIIISIYVYYQHEREVVWWEYVIIFSAPLLFILIAKSACEYAQTRDTEYLGGYVTTAEYFEDWDEEVPCSHPIYCTRTYECGDGKTSRTCTEQYECGKQHAYDVDY